jgi:hypothetical protein
MKNKQDGVFRWIMSNNIIFVVMYHRHKLLVLNYSIVACICCLGNVFTESLPSNGRRDTQTQRLMGEIYEVRL